MTKKLEAIFYYQNGETVGIIGQYFFENEQRNAEGNQIVITDVSLPQLANVNISDLWFQQDGATTLTAIQTIQLLCEKYPGRVIYRFGDANWLLRSCDLTPLDYFLWGPFERPDLHEQSTNN